MGDPLSVRAAKKEDLPRIAELENELFAGTAFSLSVLMQLFGLSEASCLVAEDQEGIWGYSLSVRALDEPEVAWIMALCVHPERRGRHVGQQLLDQSIVGLQGRGISRVKAAAIPADTAAYAMYQRAGFLDTGQLTDGDLGAVGPGKILTLLLPAS